MNFGEQLVERSLSVVVLPGWHTAFSVEEEDFSVVLASFACGGLRSYVITKSGAFGTEDQICRLQKKLADLNAAAEA